MNALSEFDDLLKNVFLTQEKNNAGIYAVKLYVRGKPWIITVDDEMMFYEQQPYFAMPGDNGSLWGPILEKAFAKAIGSYAAANGGYTATGIRALTGVPVFDYYWSFLNMTESDNPAVWSVLKAADDLNYILGAGTIGVDTGTN